MILRNVKHICSSGIVIIIITSTLCGFYIFSGVEYKIGFLKSHLEFVRRSPIQTENDQRSQFTTATGSLIRTDNATLSLKRTDNATLSLKRTDNATLSLKRTDNATLSLKRTDNATLSLKRTNDAALFHKHNDNVIFDNDTVIQIDKATLVLIEDIERRGRISTVTGMQISRDTNYTCSENHPPVNGVEDLLCMTPPTFLAGCKNPCWYSTEGLFQCLSYFQVIGMDKCGSTDLFDRISSHPDVLKNTGSLGKETQWWSWLRYGHWLNRRIKKLSFRQYIRFFSKAADTIHRNISAGRITGDGTPMDMWDMSGWVYLPQNRGLSEPRYVTPHLIRHVTPDVKLLVILRDPVDRLLSDYFFLGVGKMTVEAFHENLLKSIAILRKCTLQNSLRACLFSRRLHIQLPVRIHLGFYVVYMREWLSVFPREQFLIFRTEDFSADIGPHLQQAFTFLKLRTLPQSSIDKIKSMARKYVTARKKKDMLHKTRAILTRLYKSFNMELATLLQDNRFMWSKS